MAKRSTARRPTPPATGQAPAVEASCFESLPAASPRPPAPSHGMHVCPGCRGELVFPTDWSPTTDGRWNVVLRCPECEWTGEGVHTQPEVDAFDRVLDAGTDALSEDLRLLTRANMQSWGQRFLEALHGDHLLAEDF